MMNAMSYPNSSYYIYYNEMLIRTLYSNIEPLSQSECNILKNGPETALVSK